MIQAVGEQSAAEAQEQGGDRRLHVGFSHELLLFFLSAANSVGSGQ